MCGIAGFCGTGDRSNLTAMTSALAHRGPDGQGLHVDPELPAFLGHRRLSIIDVAGGLQPMWNEDDDVGIVFNGEIYNHAELRAALERCGHRFKSSHSDTEVLVHGYEEWGAGLLPRLNGMFAFAILDRKRRRLFLARDRFGEKPLFYSSRPGFLGFASELGALTLHPAVDNGLDHRSMQKFFAYGYLPAPHTFYKGCRKLPAGHCLTYGIDDGTLVLERYWQFRIEADESLGDRDEPRLAEELRHLLFQATERRLISDVPLGVFLSGGLDSSSVLAGVTRKLRGPAIETFTIGFTEPSFDESAYARDVASAFGTRHHERILDMETARDLVPSVLARLDEPLGDASILPTYLLSAFTREHVTVALSGDGGDELFAGYDPFKALTPAALYARLMPRTFHASLRWLADRMPVSSRNMSLDFKIRRTLMGLSYPQPLWNPVWMSPVEPRDTADLFDEPLRLEDLYGEAIAAWEGSSAASPVDRTLEFFTNFYLPDDILTKVDRASMMVSLESRAVFLDNDLVEFCQRLPHRFKFRKGQRKYLLKKALAGVLPPSILGRRKKGFGIPLASWLKTFPTKPPLTHIGGIRTAAVERRWLEHRNGSTDHRLFLWSWLSLQHALAE